MNSESVSIRRAINGEEGILTELSLASKRYWPYPDHYFSVWQPELTITSSYLEHNSVYIIENHDKMLGYYSMLLLTEDLEIEGQVLNRGHWLDHMFVLPDYIGNGLGRKLFCHMCATCTLEKIATIHLLADPCAKGFYKKMGCKYVKDVPSTIAGRSTPLLRMDL